MSRPVRPGEPAGESGEPTDSGPTSRVGDRPRPVRAMGLTKSFRQADGSELRVLERVEFSVAPGEAVAVIGASGAGKSTLLHLLGGLDRPTSGAVEIGGRALNELSDTELAAIRSRKIGFVFQFHHLLREFTALENVMMPMLVAEWNEETARERATELLDSVGLSERLTHRPTELSGGEQQRVAVARALANRPLVLLADEPSGNLDESTSDRLHDLLFRLREERSLAMVLVTHNLELARRADRTLRLEDGQLRDIEDTSD
ncbi:MAG: ABC transporter ATP-binding protein [Longimicrobiales bacterium]|nr:ABC transporter ATP-binding protein [Longimicrobiales bacterium]